jgi:2-polyprenyl-6-methoxyphenol hydroxylase-like FAD-dependent oxidoreductase
MKRRTTVLVVGAGPCGLAVAAELRRLEVPVTVVEAEPGPGTGSRAILLWPPVLEVLDELGIGARAKELGIVPRALNYHLGSGRTVRVALADENAPLILPQEQTSRLLEQVFTSLGGHIERGVRVTKVVPGEDGVAVAAIGADGTAWELEADWVIGADGAHSEVRAQLGIEFTGAHFPATFLLAEGKLDGIGGQGEIHYFLADSGVALAAPLSREEFRISGAVPRETPATLEAAQRLLDDRVPGVRISEPSMLGTFGSDERMAETLRSGRCFLVGDAAHVHSPIGGQGLNLGIPDGRNLAWKLAGVVGGRLDPAILDTYEPERKAAIRQTLAATGRMARQAVVSPLARRIRDLVWQLLKITGFLEHGYVPLLAGWRSRYPDPLPGVPKARRGRLPRPGTRHPRWVPRPDRELAGRFQLITFGSAEGSLARQASELAEGLPTLVAHLPMAGKAERFVLLRPDGYIAASGRAADFPAVAAHLARLVPAARADEQTDE